MLSDMRMNHSNRNASMLFNWSSLPAHSSLPPFLRFDGDGHLGDPGQARIIHHIDHPPVVDPLIGID
jgi:hypothetical protein